MYTTQLKFYLNSIYKVSVINSEGIISIASHPPAALFLVRNSIRNSTVSHDFKYLTAMATHGKG